MFSHFRAWVSQFMPAIIMGMGAFMATFDVTAVSLALPDISRTLALDVADYVWVMNSYSLTFTITLIAAGSMSDRYGDRRSLLSGAALFLLASVICALATTFGVLVGGRILQGVGAAFIVCGGYPLIGRLYTDKADRVKAFAIMGTIGGSALAVGPGLGGLITGAFGWTWVFLLNIPICLGIIAGALSLAEHRTARRDPLDGLGIVSFSLFLLLAAWLLLYGPTIGSFAVGAPTSLAVLAALLLVFLLTEHRVAHPAVDIGLFRRKLFAGLALVPLCLAVSFWSLVVFMPLFLEALTQFSIESISFILLFLTLPMFVVPYLVTGLAIRLQQSTFYAGGLGAVATGCLGLSVCAYLSEYRLAIIAMLIAGIGAAAIQTQVSGALIASAPDDRAGGVSAIMTVLRQGGFAIGTALLSKTMQMTVDLGSLKIEGFTVLFLVCALVAGTGSVCTFLLARSDERRHIKGGSHASIAR